MKKQDTISPIDLVVELALAVSKSARTATYSELGQLLGVSSSTVFEAIKHLQGSGLLQPGTHQPNLHELRNFLVHGVRHTFPPQLGRDARGIPTAHAGPAMKELFGDARPVVWPDIRGTARGPSLTPLYPKATELPERCPEVYRVLTLVDALRSGQARERKAALAILDEELGTSAD